MRNFNVKSLDTHTLEKQIAFAKGQRIYLQSMITKRSAEMICYAIQGKFDEVKSVKEAMDQHLRWIEETNEFVSEGVYELSTRRK